VGSNNTSNQTNNIDPELCGNRMLDGGELVRALEDVWRTATESGVIQLSREQITLASPVEAAQWHLPASARAWVRRGA